MLSILQDLTRLLIKHNAAEATWKSVATVWRCVWTCEIQDALKVYKLDETTKAGMGQLVGMLEKSTY